MHPDQGMPGKEPTMLIIGCDYHPRFQKIAMLDTATGEIKVNRLEHENGEAKKFYASLPKGVLVGIEATGSTQWFERMVSECGHELWVGDPAEIRARRVRKQKTDERDALHLLDLLTTNRFPRVVVPQAEAVEREWTEATGSAGARNVGQPAAARIVDAAGRAESADRRVGPGGGSGSGAAAGSGTAAGPEGRGSGGGSGLRADAGHGRAVPAFAPTGKLPGAESARGFQRPSPVSRPHK